MKIDSLIKDELTSININVKNSSIFDPKVTASLD